MANLEPELCAAALAEQTPGRQVEIDGCVQRFGILDEDWYVPVKRELVTRGVLGAARTARPGRKDVA